MILGNWQNSLGVKFLCRVYQTVKFLNAKFENFPEDLLLFNIGGNKVSKSVFQRFSGLNPCIRG